MRFRAAIVLLGLAAPLFAQRGAAHGGSSGARGFAGHAASAPHSNFSGSGFSRPTLARPGSFAPSARPYRYNGAASPRLRSPGYAGPRSLYARNGFIGNRSAYRPGFANPSRIGDRDGDRFRERRREFNNWYANVYPAWLGYGYPYTLNPGFFPWGDTDDSPDNSSLDDSGAAYNQPGPYDQSPYDQSLAPLDNQPQDSAGENNGARPPYFAGSAIASAPAPGEPLTVIFKDGRAPVKVENYMMTATVLTDLDPQHYQKIPLDQVDLAATRRANSTIGVDFQPPSASRD